MRIKGKDSTPVRDIIPGMQLIKPRNVTIVETPRNFSLELLNRWSVVKKSDNKVLNTKKY